MINLNKKLTPSLRETIVQLIITLAINGKKSNKISILLNVAKADVSAIIRGMVCSTSGYARMTYKGLKTTSEINKDLRGDKKTRTLQEAYTLVGGSISEISPDLKEKLERMAAENLARKLEIKANARPRKRGNDLADRINGDFDENNEEKKDTKLPPVTDVSFENYILDKSKIADNIKDAISMQQEGFKTIRLSIDGISINMILPQGSRITVANEG